MRRPRALFIGPYPPPYSGPESSMKCLLESSLSERLDIIFLKTNVRTSNAAKGRLDLTTLRAFFRFVFCLVWMILRYRPQVAYHFVTATRMGWIGRDIWCIFVCRLLRLPVVLHMRAGHFKSNYWQMGPVARWLIKRACARAALGLVQSESLKSQFSALVPEERIKPVYNAIDASRYFNDSVKSYDRHKVLFLGFLSCAKGYCDVLRAIPRLAARHPEVRFLFAGDMIKEERNVFFNQATGEAISFQDPEACYNEHIRGRFEGNYEYLGNVGEERKIELLKECNFLLLPSYSEGFSMAVLEALAMGKPVICTPVGALKEVVQDGINGYLVNPGDVDALVEKMDLLIRDDRTRDAMAMNNHSYARQHFDIEVIARQIGDHLASSMLRSDIE